MQLTFNASAEDVVRKFVVVLSVLLFVATLDASQIHRSQAAKNDFKRQHPCPANGHASGPCPGYVIDHVKPLACGGADAPFNMQWQTVAEGKAKSLSVNRYCLAPTDHGRSQGQQRDVGCFGFFKTH